MPYKRNARSTEPTECKGCREVLPADDFYSCPPKANGLDSLCKACKRFKANVRHAGKRAADPLRAMRPRPYAPAVKTRNCGVCGFRKPITEMFKRTWKNRLPKRLTAAGADDGLAKAFGVSNAALYNIGAVLQLNDAPELEAAVADGSIARADAAAMLNGISGAANVDYACFDCDAAYEWIDGRARELTPSAARHLRDVFAARGRSERRVKLLAQVQERLDGTPPAHEWNEIDGKPELDTEYRLAFFMAWQARFKEYDAAGHKARREPRTDVLLYRLRVAEAMLDFGEPTDAQLREVESAKADIRWESARQAGFRKTEAKMRQAARAAMDEMAMRLDAIAAETDADGN